MQTTSHQADRGGCERIMQREPRAGGGSRSHPGKQAGRQCRTQGGVDVVAASSLAEARGGAPGGCRRRRRRHLTGDGGGALQLRVVELQVGLVVVVVAEARVRILVVPVRGCAGVGAAPRRGRAGVVEEGGGRVRRCNRGRENARAGGRRGGRTHGRQEN